MYVGKGDRTVHPDDLRWLRYQVGSCLFKYAEIEGGNLTIHVGKDMSWFSEDALNYNTIASK